mgnify:CR=1 FL=1
MPIFSRRFSLWTRLYDRLLLEPTSEARVTPMVSEVVVPVLNADNILQTNTAKAGAGDLSGTAGSNVIYFTVPDDEEWQLIELFTSTTSSATAAVVTYKNPGVNVQVTTSSTGAIAKDLRNYVLREGETISLLSTGNAGDSDRNATLVYTKTELGI